jgi:dephospho-CoA kinase
VWVDAPADLRLARAVARDGEATRPLLERWAAGERDVLVREGARERADVVVDGVTGRLVPPSPAT